MSSASISKFLLNFGWGDVANFTVAAAGRSGRLSRSRKIRLPERSATSELRLVSSESISSGCSMSESVLRRMSLTLQEASAPGNRAKETFAAAGVPAFRSGMISTRSSLSDDSWLEMLNRRIESTSSPKKSSR